MSGLNAKQVGELEAFVREHNMAMRKPTSKRTFVIFHRTWWKLNPDWPDGLEPHASRPRVIREVVGDEETAREACRVWQSTHPAGRLSDKAEFQDAATYYSQWPHKKS